MKRIVVLVSGGGTNLQALLDAQDRGEIPGGQITCVIASKPGVYALERAAAHGIPGKVLERKAYPDVHAYSAAMRALLLAEQESVHIELAPHQFGQHVGLEQLERVIVRGSQLDVDRAVEQRLLVAVAAALHGDHVLQVRFCNDGLPQVIGV